MDQTFQIIPDPDNNHTLKAVLRIRITLMRNRILLVILMRIRILLVTSDADLDPTFHFDADPDPSFPMKVQNLEKC